LDGTAATKLFKGHVGQKKGGETSGTGSHEHVVGGKSICLGFSFCYDAVGKWQREPKAKWCSACVSFLQQRADNRDAVPILFHVEDRNF
jgi:hypothetical protein